jgi:hypothetical protein
MSITELKQYSYASLDILFREGTQAMAREVNDITFYLRE